MPVSGARVASASRVTDTSGGSCNDLLYVICGASKYSDSERAAKQQAPIFHYFQIRKTRHTGIFSAVFVEFLPRDLRSERMFGDLFEGIV